MGRTEQAGKYNGADVEPKGPGPMWNDDLLVLEPLRKEQRHDRHHQDRIERVQPLDAEKFPGDVLRGNERQQDDGNPDADAIVAQGQRHEQKHKQTQQHRNGTEYAHQRAGQQRGENDARQQSQGSCGADRRVEAMGFFGSVHNGAFRRVQEYIRRCTGAFSPAGAAHDTTEFKVCRDGRLVRAQKQTELAWSVKIGGRLLHHLMQVKNVEWRRIGSSA